MHSSTILTTLALAYPSFAQYGLSWNYDSTNFFDSFNFIAQHDDFTSGFAQYVAKDEATSMGLATTNGNKVRLGVDTNNTYAADSPGRKTVRLQSKQSYDNGLLIADFAHLPVSGCGMWPAFWVYTGETASDYHEIDIIENTNAATQNSHSFYTSEQCTVNINAGDSIRTNNCHHESGRTDGCGFMAPEGTFGNAFNENGYRIVALQKETDTMKIWHFKEGEIPADIASGNPDPSTWKNPTVDMSPQSCDLSKAFTKLFVVINLTFCGSWAGGDDWNAKCAATTGQSSCNAWVANNPDDFRDTYFEINSVKLFTKGGSGAKNTPTEPETNQPEQQPETTPSATPKPTPSGAAPKPSSKTSKAAPQMTTEAAPVPEATTETAPEAEPTPTGTPDDAPKGTGKSAPTEDGTCGSKSGFSCIGFEKGECCSSKGWCGSSKAHCGTGCQSAFGNCGS